MLIRPLAKTWQEVPDANSLINAWEIFNELKLPDSYFRFMAKYNGGRIYPIMFDYTIPLNRYPSQEPVTFLDPLYDWDYVEKIWTGKVFDGRNPPGMLAIGSDPGGLEILLSLHKDSYGKIYTWLHSLSGWGEDENRNTWLQAHSFQEFMDSLYDDAEKSGYDYWHRPGLTHLERELEY